MGALIFKNLYISGYEDKQRVLCCSYSQLQMFLDCAYKWFLTYVKGNRKEIKATALDLGTVVHMTLEEYYEALKGGKEWTFGEAVGVFDLNMEMQNVQFPSEEDEHQANEQHYNMLKGLTDGTSNLAKFLNGKEIIATEKEFQLKIDLPFNVKYGDEIYSCVYVVGSIDLVVKDTSDGGIIVLDYKSGNKMFEPKKIKTNLQLPIYSLVVLDIYKRLPKKAFYYHTRFDELQEGCIPALNDKSVVSEYYKNGNLKSKQKTISEIYSELISIFESMYTYGKYKPNDTPLCCWCPYHKRYGDGTCKFGNESYWRKDIEPIGC